MTLTLFLEIYFSIAGISAFVTTLWLFDNGIEEIDTFWDWVVYNVFWIVQPIKAVIKFTKNLF